MKKTLNRAQILDWISTKGASFWSKERDRSALNLFKSMSKQVPAYKKFLEKQHLNPEKIKNWEDFKTVPTIDKKNYLRRSPYQDLSWSGSLVKPLVYTSTSGSTGAPFYFHRSFDIDQQSSIFHELFLKQASRKKEPTLVIVCFGMGVWIGGLITYQAIKHAQEDGYAVSVVTPGINKEEIFKILGILGPKYKQIVLAGYPPFLKDILDESQSRNINLHKFDIRLLFAAEPFTEAFRDYVCKLANIKNPCRDTANIYGSADIGTMAMETPLSILIRRIATAKPELFRHLFGEINKTPTLCQFIPSFTNFEAQHGHIILSGDSSLPLARYSIGDRGGVYTFDQMAEILKAEGIDIHKEAKKHKMGDFMYQLPFVYVYERTDFSTTLYGLQIYPEPIRECLLKRPLSNYLTGKFTLETRFDQNQNQYLQINLELRKNKVLPKGFSNVILGEIVTNLKQKISEYNELSKFLRDRALPHLVFWPAEDPLYFKPGVKQAWVRRHH